jgi:hypothetical protein
MDARITDSPEVTQFRAFATAFCNLVRHPQSVEIAKFLTELEKLLPLLCHAVQLLPPVERCPHYRGKWPHTTWQRLFVKLREYLGEYDSYYYVYEPYNPDDTEPIISSLSDDLADICRDLSSGLTAWRRAGAAKRRAIVDDWCMNYRIHWGDHAATAWRAIHWLVHNYDVGTDDESFKGHQTRRWKRKGRKRERISLSARNQQRKAGQK